MEELLERGAPVDSSTKVDIGIVRYQDAFFEYIRVKEKEDDEGGKMREINMSECKSYMASSVK